MCLYVPEVGFTGTDTFTYTITDRTGATATGTVTVTVGSVNEALGSALSSAFLTGSVAEASSVPSSARASVATNGQQPNAASSDAAVSDDGRYVAFSSDADNLVPGDTNGVSDVFVRDVASDTTERVSVDLLLGGGDGPSRAPSISDDGRYVAFTSEATNLVPGDTNDRSDVFVYDRVDQVTELVSAAQLGGSGDDASGVGRPAISGNGRYVAFASDASDLVVGDSNGVTDVFVLDRTTDELSRVSVTDSLDEAHGASGEPAISDDGRYVAFSSAASDLVASDDNGVTDVFLHDRLAGVTSRISVAADGAEADADSTEPAISGDGAVIAFASAATNLAPESNGAVQVYRHVRGSGETRRVSERTGGGAGSGDSRSPSLDDAGRYVAFESEAVDLVTDDTNAAVDVFLHDAEVDRTWRVSVGSDGAQAGSAPAPHSRRPALDASGAHVVVASDGANLLGNDSNGTTDVYLLPVAEAPADPPRIIPGTFVASPEGNTGSQVYDLPVHLSEPSTRTVTIDWATVDAVTNPVAQAGQRLRVGVRDRHVRSPERPPRTSRSRSSVTPPMNRRCCGASGVW